MTTANPSPTTPATTPIDELHVHDWTPWTPSPLSETLGVERHRRVCRGCELYQDEPTPAAAFGLVPDSAAIEAAAKAIRNWVLGIRVGVTTWEDYVPEAQAALAAAVPHIERAAAGNALDAAADEVKRIREHGLLPHEHYGPYDTGFEKWLRNLAAVARGGEATSATEQPPECAHGYSEGHYQENSVYGNHAAPAWCPGPKS